MYWLPSFQKDSEVIGNKHSKYNYGSVINVLISQDFFQIFLYNFSNMKINNKNPWACASKKEVMVQK